MCASPSASPTLAAPTGPGGALGRLRGTLLGLLRQGLSPGALASAVATGLALGIFPLVGVTTLLCVGVAFLLGLNQPAVQVANQLAYPLQLALLVPFLRLGEWIFGVPKAPLALGAILHGFRSDFGHTVERFWTTLWHACVAWLLVVPAAAVLLALLLRPVFGVALRRFARARGEGRA